MKKQIEIDLDERENISAIQNIIQTPKHFYVMANKKEAKLGYYLLDIDIGDPDKDSRYLINWSNKLDVANVDMAILSEKGKDGANEQSIVLSYKAVGINTFNVFVIDLKSHLIKYWHEGY